MDLMSLLTMFADYVTSFKGFTEADKIAGAILLLIAVWKSSALKPLWDKWGKWKFVVPPVLGIILGFVFLPKPIQVADLYESLKSGMLAIGFHRFFLAMMQFDMLKPNYKKFVTYMEGILRKPAQDAETKGVKLDI